MADHGYSRLMAGHSRTDEIPIQETTTFSRTNNELESADVYPRGMAKWMKERKVNDKPAPVSAKELHKFKHESTNKASARQAFADLEYWYIEHVTDKIYTNKPELQHHMRKLLM